MLREQFEFAHPFWSKLTGACAEYAFAIDVAVAVARIWYAGRGIAASARRVGISAHVR
jgi:hypothetical protein